MFSLFAQTDALLSRGAEVLLQYGVIGVVLLAFGWFIRWLVVVQAPLKDEKNQHAIKEIIKDFKDELKAEREAHERWRTSDNAMCEKRHLENMDAHKVTQGKVDTTRHSLRNAIMGRPEDTKDKQP